MRSFVLIAIELEHYHYLLTGDILKAVLLGLSYADGQLVGEMITIVENIFFSKFGRTPIVHQNLIQICGTTEEKIIGIEKKLEKANEKQRRNYLKDLLQDWIGVNLFFIVFLLFSFFSN